MKDQPVRVAVIGGSGLYEMPELENRREMDITTPFGPPSDALIVGEIAGVTTAFLPRHGRGHVHTPGEVPYRANIYALKMLGVEHVIGVSACGSLREDLAPGHIVIPDQLFDFTKNRVRSFFGDGLVAHVSVGEPFCRGTAHQLYRAVERAGGTVHRGGRFITIEGPRFSTQVESHVFRSWGMDIIGMTTSPEAFLAREAGLCYTVMAHITDYDVWHESEEAVTVSMVIERLQANIEIARQALVELVPRLATREKHCDCADALRNAIITAPDRIPEETRQRLQALLAPYL
ncbi:MAG: S-methyl-5'-thioadenosine phosphorylase [Anaerolineae bacterium]